MLARRIQSRRRARLSHLEEPTHRVRAIGLQGLPRAIALVALLACCSVAAGPAAADWPTVGGSSLRHGQSPLPGPGEPDLLWEGSATSWFGNQIYIEGDRLVTMRFQSISVAPICCHDLRTGALLWSVDFPGTNSRSVPRGFRDGRVYATNFQETGADTLYALDPADGSRLWISEVFCERGILWSIAFTPDGDLLVPTTSNHIARVRHTDGSRVWTIPRTIPNTGAEGLCVYGSTIYGFEGSIVTPKVLTAWDADTGARKYSSAALPGDGDQEIPFAVAPGGTIYVRRDGGALHALTDTGSGFVEEWRVTLAGTPYSGQFGVGLDGSVYTSDGATLVRLDPGNGSVIGRSPPRVTTSTLNPRVTVGVEGNLYVSNGGFDDGALYVMSPDLDVLWSAPILSINSSGPALGAGALAVAGRNTILNVYRAETAGVPVNAHGGALALRCSPNPMRGEAHVRFRLAEPRHVDLRVLDLLGREVRTLAVAPFAAGEHAITWDARDVRGRQVESGVYFVRLRGGAISRTEKVHVLR